MPVAPFSAFLKLGIEHIFTGYDHLMFLFGLLVACTRWKSVVMVITCFTIGHSLTLALATLSVVNLPERIGEPLIALTIVFIGLENCWRKDSAASWLRYPVTALFGLVHGFGFATVLRELGVGSGGQSIALPLFGFNLGVELGQIAFAACVIPVFWLLRRKPWFVSRGVPVLSLLVAFTGIYWLIERLVMVK